MRAIPVVVSALLLAAHFLRDGQTLLVLAALAIPCGLLSRVPVARRVVQALLVLGAAEWILTAYGIAQQRAAMGAPMLRMFLILGGVSLFTLAAAWLAGPSLGRAPDPPPQATSAEIC
jgi:hypothetical protein